MKSSYIKQLGQVRDTDVAEVGGKAASLGEMIQEGFQYLLALL
jgi:phosphoenolpyruvate synthase/pyruvate phosphate dikinase